jgi:hypothetical protein
MVNINIDQVPAMFLARFETQQKINKRTGQHKRTHVVLPLCDVIVTFIYHKGTIYQYLGRPVSSFLEIES